MTHDPLSQWTSVATQALATDLGRREAAGQAAP